MTKDDDDYYDHPFIQGYHDEDSDDYDHDPTGINRPFIGTLDNYDDCYDHGGINLFRVMRVRIVMMVINTCENPTAL